MFALFKRFTALVFILFLGSCGESSDSPFPAPRCGSADNPCIELVTFTISPANKSILVEMEQQYVATAFYSDGNIVDVTQEVDWQSSSANIATISNTAESMGLAKGIAVGSTTISASFLNQTATARLHVMNEVVEELIVVPGHVQLPVGTTQPFGAFLLLANKQSVEVTEQVTWDMVEGGVASIDANAIVTAISVGESELFASIFHNGSELTANAQVTVIESVVNEVVVIPQNAKFPVGTTGTYKAEAHYSDGHVVDISRDAQWKIENTQIAKIVESGALAGDAIAVAVGETNVSATFEGVTGTTSVEVTNAALEEIVVTPSNEVTPVGTSVQYQAHAIFSDNSNRDITLLAAWSSSEPDIANIQFRGGLSGVAKTFKPGVTQITAHYSNMSATVPLTVTGAVVESLQVSPQNSTVPLGTEKQYTATAHYSDQSIVDVTKDSTWRVDDQSLVSIEPSGQNAGFASTLATGETHVRANFSGMQATAKLTITDATLENLSISPIKATLAAGAIQQYELTAIFSDSSKRNVTDVSSWQSSDTAVATINRGGTAQSYVAGTTMIKGSYKGMSVTAELVVTEATLTGLQLNPQNPQEPLGANGQFTAVAYYSDGSTSDVTTKATWSSADPTTVSIVTSGAYGGYANSEKVGQTEISASYLSMDANTQATVTEAVLQSLSLTPSYASIPSGTTQSYQLFGLYSDGTHKDLTNAANWQSSDNNIATVDSNGIAKGLEKGDVSIEAIYRGNSATAALNVSDAVIDYITVTPVSQSISVTDKARLHAVAFYSDGINKPINHLALWQSDNPAIAAVGNSAVTGGLVTGLSAGSALITATFDGKSASNNTMVTGITLVSVSISPIDVSIPAGLTQQYQLSALYSDGSSKDVTVDSDWQSSEVNTVSIDSIGLATTHFEGMVTITGTYQGLSDSTSLTVQPAEVTELVITPVNPSVPLGTEDRFTAMAYFTDGYSSDVSRIATWSSSDASVVSIVTSGASGGYASADKIGTSEIKVIFDGVEATTLATVTEAELTKIQLDFIGESNIPVGATTTLTAIAYYSDGNFKNVPSTAIWQSSAPGVATILPSGGGHGLATAIDEGTTDFTVTFDGITSNTQQLTVTSAEITSIRVEPNEVTVPVSTADHFKATAIYSNSTEVVVTTQATWVSSDESVVHIVTTGGGAGLATAKAAGTSEITASLDGVSSDPAKVTVTGKELDNVQITPNNKSYNLGQTEQYKVSAIYTDYSIKDVTAFSQIQSLDPDVATFDSDNVMTTNGEGTAELTAVYQGMTSEREFLHVHIPELESIEITPANATVAKEQPQTYKAVGKYSDNSSKDISSDVLWSTVDGDIATINNNGRLIGKRVGTTKVQADFQGIAGMTDVTVGEYVFYTGDIVPDPINLKVGDELQLKCFGTYVIPPTTSNSIERELTEESIWGLEYSVQVASISNEPGNKGYLTAIKAGTNTVSCKVPQSNGSFISIQAPITVTE